MENYIKIPLAYQTVVDDIGWFTGDDDRHKGLPSRTGMPRKHVAEDYAVINEIGKRINQKITGAFVIGEWDKNNRMTGKPHMTPKPDEWDCKSKINMQEAERCFETIESSEYIDISLHGLLHSYWDEEMGHDDQQYYIRPRKGCSENQRKVPVSDEYFEKCIDTFFDIYRDWGFTKQINTFVSPGSAFGPPELSYGFARVLRERGFKYWANYWNDVKTSTVIEGLTFCSKGTGCVEWNVYDVNPAILPDYVVAHNDGVVRPKGTIFGLHWPNFLRFDPKKNVEVIDAWVDFYRRQGEVFGLMISRDMGFAARQAIYERYTKITYGEKEIILDFADVDASGAIDIGNTMYISLYNHLVPKSVLGAEIKLYETHGRHRTYEITRKGSQASIILK